MKYKYFKSMLAFILMIAMVMPSCGIPLLPNDPTDTDEKTTTAVTNQQLSEGAAAVEASYEKIDCIRHAFFTDTTWSWKEPYVPTYDSEGNEITVPPGTISDRKAPDYENRGLYKNRKISIRLSAKEDGCTETAPEHAAEYFFVYDRGDGDAEHLLLFVNGSAPLVLSLSLEVGGVSKLIEAVKNDAYIPMTILDINHVSADSVLYMFNALYLVSSERKPLYDASATHVSEVTNTSVCLGYAKGEELLIWKGSLQDAAAQELIQMAEYAGIALAKKPQSPVRPG